MERRRSAERPHREAARGGGREARAALEAERSNDDRQQRKRFRRASAAARSAPSAAGAQPYRSGAARDMRPRRLRRIPSLTAVRAFKQGGGQAPLGVGKTAGERHAAVGLRKPQKARVRSGGASFAENRRRKGAAPHRRRRTRARRTPAAIHKQTQARRSLSGAIPQAGKRIQRPHTESACARERRCGNAEIPCIRLNTQTRARSSAPSPCFGCGTIRRTPKPERRKGLSGPRGLAQHALPIES